MIHKQYILLHLMTSIILVESGGALKHSKVKDVAFDNLYKKCGFRVAEHFAKRTTWNVTLDEEVVSVELWSKNDGKANTENKYDFPPPVDTALYFGTCVLVRVDENEKIINLSLETWNKMYDHLFGGFDDLDEDEEPSEDELEKVPQSMKTKHGYLKDGFVVDTSSNDDDDTDEDDEDDDDEEDEDEDDDDVDVDVDVDDEDATDNDDDSVANVSKNKIGSNSKATIKKQKRRDKKPPKEELVDTLSELSEEAYEYFED